VEPEILQDANATWKSWLTRSIKKEVIIYLLDHRGIETSELCKVDMSNLGFLENGQQNPHLLTLESIADVLKVDVKDFI
jgi:transcriptional regulator with XRE-family HTH domain